MGVAAILVMWPRCREQNIVPPTQDAPHKSWLWFAKRFRRIWRYRKIGQGPSKVIIWTNYDGLESPMLHTKFRENRPTGSGEDFWRVFTIYGRGGHLGQVTKMPWTKYRSPYPMRLHMKFCFDWPSGFGEDLWALWTTDGRRQRTDAGPLVSYKLTYEPSAQGSGELKLQFSLCPIEKPKLPNLTLP